VFAKPVPNRDGVVFIYKGNDKMSKKTVKLTEEIVRRVVSESVRSLLSERYGIPNGIGSLADSILYHTRERWNNGDVTPFLLKCNLVPRGHIVIYPTKKNVRAAYGAQPVDADKPCYLFINPSIINDNDEEGSTFRATLIHELTHLVEDMGRQKSGGLAGEIDRIGHEKAFNNVLGDRMLDDNKDKYTKIERDVNRAVFYGASFERNARNAAMFAKLRDVPRGSIKTYQDALNFVKSTKEYMYLDCYITSVNRLLSLTKEDDKKLAMDALEKASNYHFKNWNQFCSWLRRNEERYRNKMRTMIPKMIAAVMQEVN
jgi:hypothetical protein